MENIIFDATWLFSFNPYRLLDQKSMKKSLFFAKFNRCPAKNKQKKKNYNAALHEFNGDDFHSLLFL